MHRRSNASKSLAQGTQIEPKEDILDEVLAQRFDALVARAADIRGYL